MICSSSNDRLHKIIGRLKFFKDLVPGKFLLYLPFVFCLRAMILSKVVSAIFLYSSDGDALSNAAKAIVAKQSLKIL